MSASQSPSTPETRSASLVANLWSKYGTLIRYAVIGGSAVVIDFGLFVLLHEAFDVPAWLAQCVSVPVSVVWSFLLNAFFNFKTRDQLLRRFVSFAVISGIGGLAGLVIILVLNSGFDLNGSLSKLISLPVVFVIQYILNTRISFRSYE